MSGINILRRLLLKDAALGSGQASGIMSIGDNVRNLAEKRLTSYLMSAQKKGIDLDKLGEQELKYMLEMNKSKSPKVIAADSPEGKGITEALFGKKGQVIEADFGKPFSEEVKNVKKRIDSGVATTVEKMLAMEPIDAMKEANLVIGRKGPYKNLTQEDAKKILQDTEDHIFERNVDIDPEDMFADGGRIGLKDGNGIADEEAENARFAKRVRELMDEGFDMGEAVREAMKEGYANDGRIGLKKGMDRRTFMKIMGGLTTIPVFGKFFKGAEVAAPVVQKAAEVASGAPPYFFNLVNRIRALGKQSPGPKERSEIYKYKDYEMQVDNDTGQIEISKQKLGYDDRIGEGVVSEEYMSLKPGRADETTGGKKVVDEYEENTGYTDKDGKLKDVEPGVSEETVMDGSISKEELEQEIVEQLSKEAPSIKKASGGIARMLGE